MYRTLLRSLTIVVTLASGTALAGPNPLEGVWLITGTPAPKSGMPQFTNVGIIDRRGTIVNSDPDVGTGLGQMFRMTDGKFAAGFFGSFRDETGTLIRYEVQGTVQPVGLMDFTGTYRTILSSVSGDVLAVIEGELAGQRLHPQPNN